MKACICKTINKTPLKAEEHIEGFISMEVDKNCRRHKEYLSLPGIPSNEFSIELIKILEDKYKHNE